MIITGLFARNARPRSVFGRTTLLRGVGDAGARSPGTIASARSPMLKGASEMTVAAIVLLWRSAASLLTVIEPGERVGTPRPEVLVLERALSSTEVGAVPATASPGISV